MIQRKTEETDISLCLELAGEGKTSIYTGIGFFDHMLTLLAFHAGWNLEIQAVGDLSVDDHHTVEDVAICLGKAFFAQVNRDIITRYGQSLLPMDEVLCLAATDLTTRICFVTNYEPQREQVGGFSTEMVQHFWNTFVQEARMTLHIHFLVSGDNEHHRIEAMFKSTARALAQSLLPSNTLCSTKGQL